MRKSRLGNGGCDPGSESGGRDRANGAARALGLNRRTRSLAHSSPQNCGCYSVSSAPSHDGHGVATTSWAGTWRGGRDCALGSV